MTYDNKCREIIENNPNMMIPWYIMASHAYYTMDDPILSDGLYDELAQTMLSSCKTTITTSKVLLCGTNCAY